MLVHSMELRIYITEDDSEAAGYSHLSICTARIVSETEYRRIAQAVQIASDVMHLEALPLSSDGCLFHWRSLSTYGFAYAHAFQSVFEFLGMVVVIHLRTRDSTSQGLVATGNQPSQASIDQHDDRH